MDIIRIVLELEIALENTGQRGIMLWFSYKN